MAAIRNDSAPDAPPIELGSATPAGVEVRSSSDARQPSAPESVSVIAN
jgi:hypothetical protein